MTKKILISILALIVIPTAIFLPVYALMAHTVHNDLENFQDTIIGDWEGIQFYHNNERFVCDDDTQIALSFSDGKLEIKGNILTEGIYPYNWAGASSMRIDYEGTSTLLIFSHASSGYLQIAVDGLDYKLIFRPSMQE